MTERDRWHIFHGWCVARGVQVGELAPPSFLDLVHHYMLRVTKPESHERLNRQLVGPPRVDRPSLVDERAGFVPPTWWRGDEYASRSSVLAASMMRR